VWAGDRDSAERRDSLGAAQGAGIFSVVCADALDGDISANEAGAGDGGGDRSTVGEDFSVDCAGSRCGAGAGVVRIGGGAEWGTECGFYD
jgi:hypothetical protein